MSRQYNKIPSKSLEIINIMQIMEMEVHDSGVNLLTKNICLFLSCSCSLNTVILLWTLYYTKHRNWFHESLVMLEIFTKVYSVWCKLCGCKWGCHWSRKQLVYFLEDQHFLSLKKFWPWSLTWVWLSNHQWNMLWNVKEFFNPPTPCLQFKR